MKLTATLCALLAVGCVSTQKVEEPKPVVVRICPSTIPEVVIQTQELHTYHILLSNTKLVEGYLVYAKGKHIRFCSKDPDVFEKSYLEGEIAAYAVHKSIRGGVISRVSITLATEYHFNYQVNMETDKKPHFLKGSTLIAVPTIEPLESKCSQGGRMYEILHENDYIDPKQIKVIKKK